MNWKAVNQTVLTVFAPLLIFVGVAGFLLPPSFSLTSNAAPYNLFHIFFGAIGLILLTSGRTWLMSLFNLIFGFIDLYQLVASYLDLWPKQYFLWNGWDDFLHLLFGVLLVGAGMNGLRRSTASSP